MSIKKAGRTQIHHDDERATISSGTIIKTMNRKKLNEQQIRRFLNAVT